MKVIIIHKLNSCRQENISITPFHFLAQMVIISRQDLVLSSGESRPLSSTMSDVDPIDAKFSLATPLTPDQMKKRKGKIYQRATFSELEDNLGKTRRCSSKHGNEPARL